MQTTIEVWEEPQSKVQFFFSYAGTEFTTGVLVIPPHTALPKHNRPLAVENLTQIAGRCIMQLFDDNNVASDHVLEMGKLIFVPKAQYHIHSNPFDEPSYTLFKGDGDISVAVDQVRKTFTRIQLRELSSND